MKRDRIYIFEQLVTRFLSRKGIATCLICDGNREHIQGLWNPQMDAHSFTLRHWLCARCEQSIPWIRRICCPCCGRGMTCPDCMRKPTRAFAWNRSAVSYDASMREWLAQYKFRGKERLLPLLASMMLPLTRMIIHELKMRQQGPVILTYVPLSRERQAERGFNQAEQLAAYLANTLRLPLSQLLHRQHHTEKQSFKNRRSRLQGLQGVFSFEASKGLLAAREARPFILIVDDVYTTGSTIEEAAKTIREHLPCDVAGLTWARA